MTVYRLSGDKIRIALSDSEVLSFFGTYEKFASLSGGTRLAVSLLLKESLEKYSDILGDNLLVEIKARKSAGCVITVSPAVGREREKGMIMLIFRSTDDMIAGISRLYAHKAARGKSSLYKMANGYRLILSGRSRDFYFMTEFCTVKNASEPEIAYTEEYGGLLCRDTAVQTVGKAFSKDF